MATIKTVGIIGAGQMGAGIAHVCALAGYDVLLHDVSSERIDAGHQVMNTRPHALAETLRLEAAVH